ncbi:MAG: Lrp/AsnC family transcriptional regulator [Deltaproteobacteria bacterium]|nr:Lrp/AsnC family transcriptional regulator [Deltaproteobacteria bacterium]
MEINKTDRKLMMELQRDGGISYAELAARLDITPKTIAKRVEGLLKSNVIAIIGQPNPFKLGLSASALIAIKTDPSKVEHVCEHLAENFHVNLVQTVFGRFDVFAIVYYPNWDMLHHFVNNDIYMIDGVTQVELYFIKEIFKRYERFFKKEPYAKNLGKFKETDWALIERLSKNGRSNSGELAEELGLHVSSVYRRISALLKRNIIKISGVPNPSRLAYQANAYITLDVDPKEVENICNSLHPYPEVQFIMTLNNRSGVIVCVHTKDNESLYEFLKARVSTLKGLLNTETFIRSMVKKTYYGWLIDSDEDEGIGGI